MRPALLVLLIASGVPAMAQSLADTSPGQRRCAVDETIRFRGGTFRLENDLFTNTDNNYTSGVAVTAVSHDIPGRMRTECVPAPVRWHAEFIKWVNPEFWEDAGRADATTQNVTVKFGQSMYTPEDYARTDLIENDRPYAGLLYLGMAWNRRRPAQQSTTEILDTRELTLGIIGPASLAHEAQDVVHDLKGVEKFRGWNNQLHNEPAFQLAMDRKFRTYQGDGAVIPGFSADAIRSLGLRLGNIETSATVGIEGRIGWNLPNDFGSYPITPGAENRPPSAAVRGDAARPSATRPRPGMHLFSTLEAKLVGYDFSLDGNLFRSSHRVTRRPWVAQASIGVSVQSLIAGHGVRLATMWVSRTKEFEEQRANHHSFGSVALSIEF